MYTRGVGQFRRLRGMGQTCSDGTSPSGGVCDDGSTPSYNCSAGSGSACAWYDNVWATQGCLGWYAQCDPTNAFYVTNTKGLIVGGAQVVGTTVGSAVGGAVGNTVSSAVSTALAPEVAATGIPTWAWVAGAGLAALLLLPIVLKAFK